MYTHSLIYVYSNNRWRRTKIQTTQNQICSNKMKEALYIRANDRGYLMNPEKGTLVNDCWNEFNMTVRETIYF